MTTYNGQAGGSPEPLCDPARSLVHMVEQTILSKFTPDQTVSPAQVQAAQDLLQALYDRRAATLELCHYPAAYGSHQCLADVIDELSFRISALALMQPEPQPTPAPERRHPQRSPDEVVNDLASLADDVKRPGDTFLGEERGGDTAPGDSR
jgi:hypothetical protein